MRTEKGNCTLLTKGRNDGTRNAVGHTDCKDTHGPGVLQAKLELVGLTLQTQTQTQRAFFKKHLNQVSR